MPHLVEHGENFWTISRLYYNSGRYHRALWKANSDKYPDINVLHVGDTIMIPPVEDLDQAYILPSRTHTPSAFAGAERSLGGRGNGNRQDDATDSAEPVSVTILAARADLDCTHEPALRVSRWRPVAPLDPDRSRARPAGDRWHFPGGACS